MGWTQLLPLVVLAIVVATARSRMKRIQKAASSGLQELVGTLSQEFAAIRRPGESEAAFVSASTRNKLKANQALMVAVTNQRVFVKDLKTEGPMRAFDRSSVRIAAPQTRWTDIGNMQVTYSDGWELSLRLPGGESYSGLRMYGADPYYIPQAENVPQFLAAIGSLGHSRTVRAGLGPLSAL
jgi:hypothetical protein